MVPRPMLSLTNVSKRHGNQVLLMDTSMELQAGEHVGLVGPNGSGKSTIFRMIMGEEHPDDGEITIPKRVTVGHFRQDLDEMSGCSVLDETIAGSGRVGALHHELEQLEHDMADPDKADDMNRILARFGEVQNDYQNLGGYELEARAREVLQGLGLLPVQIDGDVGALSGGWKMRVGMAKVLLGNFDILLMDEPTNHLDIESILWLEGFLKQSKAAVLMTCHDRDFMNRVVTRIIDIDSGELVSYSGNYDFMERGQRARESQAEATYARQQAMLAKMQRFIDRFGTHVAKAAQAQSRAKKMGKIERVEPPRKRSVVPFKFSSAPRIGDDVLKISRVEKGYGAHTVYEDLGFEIQRGERWCVMGQNGSGKTTLLRMVAGVLDPDAGEVKLGASVKLGYFAQAIAGSVGSRPHGARACRSRVSAGIRSVQNAISWARSSSPATRSTSAWPCSVGVSGHDSCWR